MPASCCCLPGATLFTAADVPCITRHVCEWVRSSPICFAKSRAQSPSQEALDLGRAGERESKRGRECHEGAGKPRRTR
eukprot:727359-Rhodomonas_salina.1